MSETTAEQSDKLQRDFARFVRRLRRRAWMLLFLRYWLIAVAICALLASAMYQLASTNVPVLIGTGVTISLVAALVASVLGRRTIDGYVEIVDRHYDAAGRILAAAEFLRASAPPDAFRKLAIEDAVVWIAKHPRRGLPWTLSKARRRATSAALCIAAVILVGCESPQPTARQKPESEPEVPQSYPVPRAAQKKPQGATADRTTRQAQRTDADSQKPQASTGTKPSGGGRKSDKRTQPGGKLQDRPVEQKESSGAAPSKPDTTSGRKSPVKPSHKRPGPSDGESDPDHPEKREPSESGSPGGRQAGTEQAEKKQDNREVDAPEDDVQARDTDGDETADTGPVVEGTGEEFSDGTPQPVASQPTTPMDYRDARQQDLTRERVSPARRALIERYFQKLRQPSRKPTSQPASRPTSQPEKKARRP